MLPINDVSNQSQATQKNSKGIAINGTRTVQKTMDRPCPSRFSVFFCGYGLKFAILVWGNLRVEFLKNPGNPLRREKEKTKKKTLS